MTGLLRRLSDAVEACAPWPPAPEAERPFASTWFWTFLLGVAMLIGGLMALVIAATRVVLPYDEALVGLSRDDLAAINPRLLLFMAHDRISLAGTMLAVGIMYAQLSWHGVRDGQAWARAAIFVSAFSGFITFFLFLGFGYFDPFHAFVTSVLFQFLLLALHSNMKPGRLPKETDPTDDGLGRLGLWGQWLWVAQACGLIGAGTIISALGSTQVFVHEDLEFMNTTAEALAAVSPRLLPLIAHDRATFGGMLLASGLVLLFTALWGYRRATAWLWWTLLAASTPAYAAAILVHFVVGYDNWFHLTPAIGGWLNVVTALGLSYPYLTRPRRSCTTTSTAAHGKDPLSRGG